MSTQITQKHQEVPAHLINGVKTLLKKHVVDQVIAAGVFGAHSRGYADISADKDIVCLMRRRNSVYLSLDTYLHKEQNREQLEEARAAEITMVSRSISEELGENISISLIDERALLLGIMRGIPSKIGAMHSLAMNSKYVTDNYLTIYKKYFDPYFNALRYMDAAKQQLERLSYASASQLYRQERNYLTALWSIMRAVEFMDATLAGEEHGGLMTFEELKTSTIAHPAFNLYSNDDMCQTLFDPYYRRIEREHLDNVISISKKEEQVLREHYIQALDVISQTKFGTNYKPDNETIAKEMMQMLLRNQDHFDKLDSDE